MRAAADARLCASVLQKRRAAAAAYHNTRYQQDMLCYISPPDIAFRGLLYHVDDVMPMPHAAPAPYQRDVDAAPRLCYRAHLMLMSRHAARQPASLIAAARMRAGIDVIQVHFHDFCEMSAMPVLIRFASAVAGARARFRRARRVGLRATRRVDISAKMRASRFSARSLPRVRRVAQRGRC